MLRNWAKHRVKQLYHAWAGPDPQARPRGPLFDTLSFAWRGSKRFYRRWKKQPTILLALDGVPLLTGFGSITGWVIGRDAPIARLEVWVGNKLLATTRPDVKRPDVDLTFPHFQRDDLLGFRFCPAPELLENGIHQVRIVAVDELDNLAEIHSPLVVNQFTRQDSNDLPVHLHGSNREYQHWLQSYDWHHFPQLTHEPVISIAMPVYRPRHQHLIEAIQSVRDQTYRNWEMVISDDGNDSLDLSQLLLTYAEQDQRIKVVSSPCNQGISHATNLAIRSSSGEFIAFMDQDDRLHPQALEAIATQMQKQPADLYYTDEDRLDSRGERVEPFLKPEWSPALLKCMMYAGHLCVYRRSMLDRSGLCDSSFDGTQDWELALRVTDQPGCRVVHVPGVFYHWRIGGHSADAVNNERCHERGELAVTASVRRAEVDGDVEKGFRPCTFTIRPRSDSQKVAILIPTRNNHALLKRCVDSIRQRTRYSDYEIILIDNGSSDQATLDYLRYCPVDRLLKMEMPFNHSALNNRAASQTDARYLLMLNDDTEVLSDDWLERLVEQASKPEAGAVGALLLFPDGRIQHAGIILEPAAVARHLSSASMFDGIDRGLSLLTRPVSAVTGACLMVRRQLFLECGGLDEAHLPTSFNDVDLCLKLKQRGYQSIMVPQVRLIHHESASRSVDSQDDTYRQILRDRYGSLLQQEAFWNPLLGISTDAGQGLAYRWQ